LRRPAFFASAIPIVVSARTICILFPGALIGPPVPTTLAAFEARAFAAIFLALGATVTLMLGAIVAGRGLRRWSYGIRRWRRCRLRHACSGPVRMRALVAILTALAARPIPALRPLMPARPPNLFEFLRLRSGGGDLSAFCACWDCGLSFI
jgi:hypothetical protein